MPEWIQHGVGRHFLHPNRTKLDMVVIYGELIDQATHSYEETHITDTDQFVMARKSSFDRAEGLAKFRVPNPVGMILYAMLFPSSQSVVKQKCNAAVSHRATLILIALHRYKMIKGSFPLQLASLAPEFLSSVPLDPYDGRPMRYAPQDGLVYSVGEDLEDSVGSTELLENSGAFPERLEDKEPRNAWQRQWMTKDIVFQIDKDIEQAESTVPSKAAPRPSSDVR